MRRLLTKLTVDKDIKRNMKKNYVDNHFHNTLKLFEILPNFPITASETKPDYYL